MPHTIRVRIHGGRVEPMEPIPITEGEGVLTVIDDDFEKALADFRSALGALKGTDLEARVAAMYLAREEGTRPLDRR